jgi:hypothetical protein
MFSVWRGTIRAVFSAPKQGARAVELHVRADDGTRRSVIVKPLIFTRTDDTVSLVYARHAGARSGVLVGLVNHTTGRWCSMPQGIVPIRLRPALLPSVMGHARRLTIPGTAALLTAVAAVGLHIADKSLEILTWLLIAGVILALLWAFNELANWQAEVAEKLIVSHTDEFLADLAAIEVEVDSLPALADGPGPTRILTGELWTPDLEADWTVEKSHDDQKPDDRPHGALRHL